MDRISQFEADWIKAATAGSGDADALYQELKAIQTEAGGPDSTVFREQLKKINADLNDKQALSGLTIEGVADDDKRVVFSDFGGTWELAKLDGQITGVPQHSGPRGNVFLGVLNNQSESKFLGHHQLYDHGIASIKPANVKQGQLGDCYFMAAVAEMAAQNPDGIWKMIRDKQFGGYSVAFPGKVAIDIAKPNPFELEHFAPAGDGDWANALEKAHRRLTGKELVESGGDPADAMALLTGNTAQPLTAISEEQMSKALSEALRRKDLVVAATRDPRDNESVMPPNQLKLKHAYSVLAYDPDTKIVTVRDPEGSCTYQNKYACGADGNIRLTLPKFMEEFPTIDRCSSNISAPAEKPATPFPSLVHPALPQS